MHAFDKSGRASVVMDGRSASGERVGAADLEEMSAEIYVPVVVIDSVTGARVILV